MNVRRPRKGEQNSAYGPLRPFSSQLPSVARGVGLPRLVLTRQMTSVAPEARWLFVGRPDEGEQEPWVAVVVHNPVVRVTTKLPGPHQPEQEGEAVLQRV